MWELTFWKVDILGVDILGVEILGVDILGRTRFNMSPVVLIGIAWASAEQWC